jgi:YidC/Oxa1 family membrane protein insertase
LIPAAHWVAVKSQYFALVLSSATNAETVSYAPVTLPHWPEAKDKPAPVGVTAAVELPLTRGTNGQASCQFTYYAGPKDYDQLSALGQNQEEAMDFGSWMDGYTGIFGLVLLWALNLFFGLVHNYGVAIILVTLTIKILFWPIQAKSIRSMKAMQKFQPQIQKIKEKYKDDAARLNQETMKLYKEHKINPVAGCLPMLVQMPVLFGFYKLLMCDIALRGASFLWIKDLALPDTVAIIGGIAINPLPIAMALSGILQQKLTPTTGDAQQAKMMLFMPLVMMFMFYNLAAGLTLYYTLQQLLSVLQQWLAMRHDKKSTVPAPIAGKPK